MLLQLSTWQEVETYLKTSQAILIPIGSTEQHGPIRRKVVLGDTPRDVEAAQAVGATAIAVATGGYSHEELVATGADIVLPDFNDRDQVVAAILAED